MTYARYITALFAILWGWGFVMTGNVFAGLGYALPVFIPLAILLRVRQNYAVTSWVAAIAVALLSYGSYYAATHP